MPKQSHRESLGWKNDAQDHFREWDDSTLLTPLSLHVKCSIYYPSYLMYKYIFFGVISVGRQKQKKNSSLDPKALKHIKNFCLPSKVNSDAWTQSSLQTSNPRDTHLAPPHYHSAWIQAYRFTQIHTETPLPSHLSLSHMVCNQSPRFPSQQKQSKPVKRTGHSCELGSPYTETKNSPYHHHPTLTHLPHPQSKTDKEKNGGIF